MSKYREAAIFAVELISKGKREDPADAWEDATRKFFPTSTNLQDKGCPKGAFLGLCRGGLIKGITASERSRATKNGEYAVQAVEILKTNKFLVSQPDLLWKKIAPTKSHNHQLDVVIGLWQSDLIQ